MMHASASLGRRSMFSNYRCSEDEQHQQTFRRLVIVYCAELLHVFGPADRKLKLTGNIILTPFVFGQCARDGRSAVQVRWVPTLIKGQVSQDGWPAFIKVLTAPHPFMYTTPEPEASFCRPVHG
jgi:hypothetical protein